MSTFGSRLREAREKKGYNQKQFAELLGVTPTRLNYWEKDKREPNVLNIKKILAILKIDSDYILGIERQSTNDYNSASSNLNEKLQRLDKNDLSKAESYVDGLLSQDKYNEEAAADAKRA